MAKPKYKLLDCDDRELLRMPDGALKLYMFYRMCGDEMEESFYSLRGISAITGQDKNTIMKWRDYLLQHGRLVETDETAADRYKKATRGAHEIPVMRVSENFIQENAKDDGEKVSENLTHPKIQTKVYGSGSSSVSSSLSIGGMAGSRSTNPPRALAEKAEEKTQTENPKPKTRRAAKDGTPVPLDINSWSLEERLAWSREHNGTGVGPSARPRGEEAKPKPKVLPDLCSADLDCDGDGFRRANGQCLCDMHWTEDKLRREAARL